MPNKTSLRNFIGDLPLAAELDYALRHAGRNRDRKDHYNLSRLAKSLPRTVEQVKPFIQSAKPGKNILFFATLHYWIEQAAYISLTLAGALTDTDGSETLSFTIAGVPNGATFSNTAGDPLTVSAGRLILTPAQVADPSRPSLRRRPRFGFSRCSTPS